MGTEEKRDTMPAPPPDGVEEAAIPKGQARAAVLLCMGELAKAMGAMETAYSNAIQLMQALARALDAEAEYPHHHHGGGQGGQP